MMGQKLGTLAERPYISTECPRLASNQHASRHRPSTCCVYHSATRASHHGLRMQFYTKACPLSIPILSWILSCASLFGAHNRSASRRKDRLLLAVAAACLHGEKGH